VKAWRVFLGRPRARRPPIRRGSDGKQACATQAGGDWKGATLASGQSPAGACSSSARRFFQWHGEMVVPGRRTNHGWLLLVGLPQLRVCAGWCPGHHAGSAMGAAVGVRAGIDGRVVTIQQDGRIGLVVVMPLGQMTVQVGMSRPHVFCVMERMRRDPGQGLGPLEAVRKSRRPSRCTTPVLEHGVCRFPPRRLFCHGRIRCRAVRVCWPRRTQSQGGG
jgi:hypothetical protein